jgi:hypothetical protein
VELIKDNYLRSSGTGATWHVDIDPPKRKVKSYFEETLITAEYMYANKTGKLLLMLSGGLDSEYVFRIFHHLKFDFTPVIIRFVGKHYHEDYNAHDTKQAFKLCAYFNVTPTVITFDFDKFVDSGELFEDMHRYRSGGFGISALIKVASSLDGFTVYGNDPPYMRLNNGVWQLEEEEKIHAILRYYEGLKLNGCPFLLSYTPEMMLSFLLDPTIVKLANGKYPGKTGTNSSKSYVFNNGSEFNMDHYDFATAEKLIKSGNTDRSTLPRIKMHGWEVIVQLPWWQNQEEVKTHFHYREDSKYLGCYKENYHDVVKRLSIYQ